MPAHLTPKKVFINEPYKSIIFLLSETRNLTNEEIKKGKTEGLTLKQIQYALMKEHYLYAVGGNTHNFLDGRIEKLIRSKKFKKYEMKDIKREKKRRTQNKEKKLTERAEKARVVRNNILHFLNKLMNPKTNAIYQDKDNNKYKINLDFYNEGIRLENKDAIDFCPSKDIRYVPTFSSIQKYRDGGHVIYGLSDEIYNSFDDKDRDFVQNGLKKINHFFDKLQKLKDNKHDEEIKKRLQRLLDSTNSNEIKRFIRKEGDTLYWEICNGVMINQDTKDTIDITKSKKYFFLKFGFPFLILREMQDGESFPPVFVHKELNEGQKKCFSNKKKPHFTQYVQIWSERLTRYCEDTYSFTLSEIEEMLQWGWDNLDSFVKWRYPGIMYSIYDIYEENGITKLLEIG